LLDTTTAPGAIIITVTALAATNSLLTFR